ncbi:MAG: hypothetical protein K9K67_03405 [Bacteriovoracaceae bacterium]|nr:hypothetical protein [Bacteriovoracaceae bacterium]
MKKIYLITSKELPHGTRDDQLVASLHKKDSIEFAAWEDLLDDHYAIEKSDKLILRSPWNYLRNKKAFLTFCHKFSEQLLNPYPLVQWNIDKSYLKEIGSQIIPMVDLVDFLETPHMWPHYVVKPYISASAFHTLSLKGDPPKQVIEWAKKGRGHYFVQPFCDSILSQGERSLIFFNRHKGPTFSHAVIKKPKPGDFRVQEEFGGSMSPLEINGEELDGIQAIFALIKGFNWLYARIDLVFFDGLWRISELEMIEPDLYLRTDPSAAGNFRDAILELI